MRIAPPINRMALQSVIELPYQGRMFTRRSLLAAPALLPLTLASTSAAAPSPRPPRRKTRVSIVGQAFHINGKPTYAGRRWQGKTIEGLLLNSRMVQGIFDDENTATRHRWAYPDGPFDAERNTREFVAAMPLWRRNGLLGFTINLQGGSPQGYSAKQPWINSAFDFTTGALKPAYMARLETILNEADRLGMVPILGLFYFGQAHRFANEQAVLAATDAATDWLVAKGYRNVLGNIATPARRLLVSTSYTGGAIPGENVAATADFLLLHGNGVEGTARIAQMVEQTRGLKGFRNQPVLFNEDDHFDFDTPVNHFTTAIGAYASWGYFDFRKPSEAFAEGYQSMPADWGINSERKRDFFRLVGEISGATRRR